MFALLALVALSLAAIGLIRSAETSTLIIGNLGFRQEATAVAEHATEAATAYLKAATSLDNDDTSNGYYASSHDSETIDVTGLQYSTPDNRTMINWDGDNCGGSGGLCLRPLKLAVASSMPDIVQQYVILRLCPLTGAANSGGNTCSQPPSTSSGNTDKKGGLSYAEPDHLAMTAGAYYRIVVRVKSSRDTTSFTETIVHQ
ncbi:MAG: hypothetical protein EOP36_11535 [Rubrivivax sp.]|nr:MAG: hypothetical protein EOP36_11535 [Rubrivivax sp.]